MDIDQGGGGGGVLQQQEEDAQGPGVALPMAGAGEDNLRGAHQSPVQQFSVGSSTLVPDAQLAPVPEPSVAPIAAPSGHHSGRTWMDAKLGDAPVVDRLAVVLESPVQDFEAEGNVKPAAAGQWPVLAPDSSAVLSQTEQHSRNSSEPDQVLELLKAAGGAAGGGSAEDMERMLNAMMQEIGAAADLPQNTPATRASAFAAGEMIGTEIQDIEVGVAQGAQVIGKACFTGLQ
eukprot:365288-Chlamydomonas_euryale.AAC.5